MPSSRIHAALGFGLGFLLIAGCGAASHERTEVTGLLTLDGRPLPSGLLVTFMPEDSDAAVARGATDLQSRYTAYAEPGKIGLAPGRYIVSVELPFASEPGPYTGPPDLAGVKIPEHYQTGVSTLTLEVPQDGPIFNIPMTTHE